MKKGIRNILTAAFLVYLCLVGGLYVVQRSMIYFPPAHKSDITPYIHQGVFETTVETADGLTLSAWMQNPEEDKEIIVFFHGNASSLENTIYKAAPYSNAGYGFLLVNYRGYEGQGGQPSEQGFYADARAWIKKLGDLGIAQEKIILYGESIGTGVAVQMAKEFPLVKAMILESPYTSLPDVAAKTYFFIPVHLLMKDKFDSLSKIAGIHVPLFVIQGLRDNIVPPSLGQKLFAAANDPKEILQLDQYTHNNMPDALKAPPAIEFLKNLD
ncbi:MAG TPA: alpha/beta hydrolase [Alphaproteobacteria bacterium]|nr:alpha/beta hydrolase [Alphaproteobacteria bacterium]